MTMGAYQNFQSTEKDLFTYHEFVTSCHVGISNALAKGQKEDAKRLAIQLYIFARGNLKETEKPSQENLIKEVRELQKQDFETIYISAVYALYDAGYSGVQENLTTSFFKSIMKNKKKKQ